MKPGRAGTMTHDCKRHGTTTLFAALNVLDGTVIGHNMKRHRHQEFIRFLNAIEAQMPKRKAIHAIVDNYVTHKHPKVRVWLARPRAAPGDGDAAPFRNTYKQVFARSGLSPQSSCLVPRRNQGDGKWRSGMARS
jgi:hypothetical protein